MTVADVRVTRAGSDIRVEVVGEVDLANRDDVADQLHAAITNDAMKVELSLAGVTYIDSAGLRVLFTLADRLRLLQVDLVLLVPAGSVIGRVVELSGLDQVVEVVGTPPDSAEEPVPDS